jgi:hypothetical protein
MAFALTTKSTIECPHKGTVTPSSSAKLMAGGKPVLLKNQWEGWAIEGCTTVEEPSKSITKCKTVLSESGGDATKLSVGGVAVLLGSAEAITSGTPGPYKMTIQAGESKLQAV